MQEVQLNTPSDQRANSNEEEAEHLRTRLPGRILGAARRLTGLRQSQMAECVGVSVSMLKLLEREGAVHVEPFCKSLNAYLQELDNHGVNLALVGNEVALKTSIN